MLPEQQYQLGDTDSNNVILSFLRAKAVFDFPLSTNRANWIQVSRTYVLELILCFGMSNMVMQNYGNVIHWPLSAGCIDWTSKHTLEQEGKEAYFPFMVKRKSRFNL